MKVNFGTYFAMDVERKVTHFMNTWENIRKEREIVLELLLHKFKTYILNCLRMVT